MLWVNSSWLRFPRATEDYIFYDEDFLQLKKCISVITEMGIIILCAKKKRGAVEFLDRCLEMERWSPGSTFASGLFQLC